MGAAFTHFYSFQVYFYAYNVFLQVGLSPAQTRYISLGVGITEILTTALCVSGSSAEFHSAAVPVSFQPLETTANGDPATAPFSEPTGVLCADHTAPSHLPVGQAGGTS